MSSAMDPAALLLLSTVPRLGSLRIRRLVARFKTVDNILKASPRQLVEVAGIDKVLAHNIKKGGNTAFVKQQMMQAQKQRVRILSYWDDDYPKLLKQANDPPLFLFVRGDVHSCESAGIGIVGTRAPSTYGKLMADRFARELSSRNLVVVSGLARGVDTIAHQATVQSNGITIGVLGSGLDRIYPEENKKLAAAIAERGALISEFPMGAKPDAPNFPRRNRVISGLSVGILVIEAGKKSGALITADFALEQNREVFALPGNINNPKSYGCNYLIQQGAKLVVTVDDILEEIGQTSNKNTTQQQTIQLAGLEAKIYNTLSTEPKHIDRIAAECQMSTSQALGVLLTLELKNIVQQLVGKHFVRNL